MSVIYKVLDILEVFLRQGNELGLFELSESTGLNASSTHRIVSALVRRGYLSQMQKRGKYSLTTRLLEFSNVIRMRTRIRDVAIPFLDMLSKETNEFVGLSIRGMNEAVCIEGIESRRDIRLSERVGARFPLYCTGVGKVLSAFMKDHEIETFLQDVPLVSRTPNTIVDPYKLRKELLKIRREGIAIDNEEYAIGIRCVAAPIRDSNGNTVAVINITAPSVRLGKDRLKELKSLVIQYSQKISKAIGYVG